VSRLPLRQIPLFAGCSDRDLGGLERIAADQLFAPGEELARQGEPGDRFFALVDGSVEVVQDGEVIGTMGAGEYFGEIALLSHAGRTATVRTTSPTRALVIEGRRFRALLGRAPHVQLAVLEAIRSRTAAA
jgi:CRP/FNR family transcriptional regulator, cyclic AMP receptor protein